MPAFSDSIETATAHHEWDRRWRDDAGRADWLMPEPDVATAIGLLRQRAARDTLDLGCGVGRHALALAEAGFAVSAIDGSAGGIDYLREQAQARRLAIDAQIGLMTDLPFADAGFDYVLAWNVIYHGDGAIVDRCIAEIRRVLRPGGLFQGTMLSKRNGNFGAGREVAADTFVIDGVDDKAHPHFYCDAAGTVARFCGFEMLSLVDREHRKPGSWHWHLLAERV
jgi:SAM-dependent methyltransferase